MTSVLDRTGYADPSRDTDQPVRRPGRPDDDAVAVRNRLRGRLTLGALLAVTAVAYLWGLSKNGWANSFYAAAAQAGGSSWKAWFFGASDAAASITVDKLPASLWVMGLSVRIFGLSSWSILVPEALMGVASVGLLFGIVRRRFGVTAGAIAGLVLAFTPVALMMFRFNNPDALLVLLMIAATGATLRGIETGRMRWVVFAGALVGFAFLTKQLQAFLVLPGLAIPYLVFGKKTWLRRLGHLAAALGALVVSAGWYVAVVSLWPASSRPYIGGSQNNSILELTLGYNGFGRLTGNETGSVGGGGMNAGGNGTGMWGQTGILRMFQAEQGGQIAWLIPAALILLVAGLVAVGRARRTDSRRAFLVSWGLWLVVTMATFSFMAGIFHAYYTVALAPAIAALVGAGSVLLWRRRTQWWARIVLAVTTLATGALAYVLLNRSATFLPWLRYAVVAVAVLAAIGLLFVGRTDRVGRRFGAVVGLSAMLMAIAGPFAYSVDTIGTATTGSIVSAGPRVSGSMGGPGGGMGGMRGGPGGFGTRNGTGTPPQFGQNGTTNGTSTNGMPGTPPTGTTGTNGSTTANGRTGGFGGFGSRNGGGMGGLLNGSTPSAALVAALDANASSYTWVAATIGANNASGYQLATQHSVMPIGGFNGTDPSPTLAQFEALVKAGKIHYFIAGGGMGGGGMGGSSSSSSITSWVEAHYTAKTVGGVTLYDLTQPKSTS